MSEYYLNNTKDSELESERRITIMSEKLYPVIFGEDVVMLTEEELKSDITWDKVLSQLDRTRWKDNPPSRFRIREERIDNEQYQ